MNIRSLSSALLAGALTAPRSQADHGVLYSEMCDPYGASSYYEETIDLGKRLRRIRTNSCPHHYNICQESECAGNLTYAIHHDVDIEIPLYPGIARDDHVKSVRCSAGTLAISLNGVSIQSLSEGSSVCGTPEEYGEQNGIGSECNLNGIDDGTNYCGDQVIAYAGQFDYCGGHADRATGLYHYHIPPSCLIDDLGARTTSEDSPSADLHSMQVGWALDGFPVYGPLGPGGVQMMPCTNPGRHQTLCLDSCNGYYGRIAGVDEYLYRYYMTGPVGSGKCSSATEVNGALVTCDREDAKCCSDVVPPTTFAPYTLGCYRGCAYNDHGCLLSNELEGTSDYFFPSLSNYAAANTSPVKSADTSASSSGTVEPDSSHVIPESAEEGLAVESDDAVVNNSKRSVLHRVLTPHRGFAISSSSSGGGTEVISLGGDTRDTFVIGGISHDEALGRLYYSTQSTISWVADDGSAVGGEIISGVTLVRILGYNFGSSVADVLSILVRGESCSSIVFVNSGEITCRLSQKFTNDFVLPPHALNIESSENGNVVSTVESEMPFQNSDVTVVCTTGRMTGIHEQPETIARGRSGRMVIASIEFSLAPHTPFAIASTSSSVVTPNSIFWSDVGGADCVYRALVDGSQIQVVLVEVPSVNDIFLYERQADAASTCSDILSCQAPNGSPDDTVFPYSSSEYDAMFYVDSARELENGSGDRSNGVVGVIPVRRDGNVLSPSPVRSSKPLFAVGQDAGVSLGSCSVSSESRGVLRHGTIDLRPIRQQNDDLLLLGGVYQPRSITVDQSTGSALIATADGILWKINIFQALKYYQELSVSNSELDCCASFTDSAGCSRFVVDVGGFSPGEEFMLPEWLKVVFSSPLSYSKFMGVTVLPSSVFNNVTSSSRSRLNNERRVFIADANMNRLWMVDIHGSNYRYIDMQQTMFGTSSKLLYPADMFVRVVDDVAFVFLSEYLGKLWRLIIPLDSMVQSDLAHSHPPSSSFTLNEAINTKGSRESVLDTVPLVVKDLSNFFVSNIVRKISPPPFLGSSN